MSNDFQLPLDLSEEIFSFLSSKSLDNKFQSYI